jgi:hypothetical protein
MYRNSAQVTIMKFKAFSIQKTKGQQRYKLRIIISNLQQRTNKTQTAVYTLIHNYIGRVKMAVRILSVGFCNKF